MVKNLLHSIRSLPIRRKFILYVLLFGTMFFAVIFVLLTNLRNVSEPFHRINELCVELRENDARMQGVHQKLTALITYAPDDRIRELKDDMANMEQRYATLKIPSHDYESYYLLRDMQNVLMTYQQYGGMLMDALSEHSYAEMGNISARLDDMAEYISAISTQLTVKLNEQVGETAQRITKQLVLFRIFLPIFALYFILYTAIFFLRMDRRFIGPIHKLVGMAREISEGNYPDEKLHLDEENEFNLLADTMFDMSQTVRDSIEEMNKRARMAQELNEKQIENLRIKAMYNQLELRQLQEQINPHFLFNCMSTLHHTAYMEGAERTCDICTTISDLLRYNFRQGDASATLAGELRNLADYIYIQGVRFGNRIAIQTEIEPGLPEITMPRMVLQPIVENCYNHGLANCMSEGLIELRVTRGEACARVSIHDNGCGMPQEKIDELMRMFDDPNVNIGNHAHVGLLNVVKRLQGFYHRQDVVKLRNEDGMNVILNLFYQKGESGDE